MNSKDYWAKRSALDMIQYMRTADETATLIRQTAEQALDVIQNEIKGIFSAFTSFGISEADAKRILSGGGTVLQQMRRAAEKLNDPKQRQALLSAINSAGAYRFRIQRLEEVSKQITQQCKELYKAQLEATETALRSVAEDAYYHTMFNLQKETGLAFSFAQFPQKQIDRILAFNWSGAHFSQRIWKNTDILAQSIKDELLVSLLSGRSNAKTMQVIREQFNVNSFCAWRLVRTESSYVSNAAVAEGYKEADIEKYRFIATLDSRTSEECVALDGKVFLLVDKKVGTNFPPMHPFCRSTTLAEFGEDTIKSLQRRARDKDGKVMKVPADMTYEEWVKKYLDKSAESDIIKSSRISYYDVEFGNSLRTSKLDVGSNKFDYISRSKLKQFEADIAYNDYETAAVFNSTGQEIFRHAGTADAIRFSAEELNNIPVGAVVTHNHPNGSLPSPEDITFLLNRGISEIRACNKQGAYVIRKGSSCDGKGYSLNDVMREYWQINNDVGSEYRDIAAKEGKNIFEYLLEVDEKALDRFCNNHGLELSWEEA